MTTLSAKLCSLKSSVLLSAIVCAAGTAQAQSIKIETDGDTFVTRKTDYQRRILPFFSESDESYERNKKAADKAAWSVILDHAEALGCTQIARVWDRDTTQRQYRLEWAKSEEMEAKGQKGNADHIKAYMVRTQEGNTYKIKHDVDGSLYSSDIFVCIKNEQSHRITPSAIATPIELRNGLK